MLTAIVTAAIKLLASTGVIVGKCVNLYILDYQPIYQYQMFFYSVMLTLTLAPKIQYCSILYGQNNKHVTSGFFLIA